MNELITLNKFIILQIINFLFYSISIIIIISRKRNICLSIRTPKILITEILSGYFLSLILIFSLYINNNILQFIQNFYYTFQGIIVFCFYIKCQRIFFCYNINGDEKEDFENFKKKKRDYQEEYFFFIIFIIFMLFSSMLIIYFMISNSVPIIFMKDKNKILPYDIYLWLLINFIQICILIKYTYKLIIFEVKQKFIFEIIFFLLLWFFYSNFIYYNICYKNTIFIGKIKENKNIIKITLLVLYLNLFITSYFPIILSFLNKNENNFLYENSNLNNFYVFLLNEECYQIFHNYLNKNNKEHLFYLNLYSHIMLYKFHFLNEENEIIQINEANKIYNLYFQSERYKNKFKNILSKIKENFGDGININNETFDCALEICYDILAKDFIKFKKTDFYDELKDKFIDDSIIKSKMINLNLIQGF